MTVDGLKGGHSGVNIHECRANANQLLTRLLRKLLVAVQDVCIASLQGGDKRCARSQSAPLLEAMYTERCCDRLLRPDGDEILRQFRAGLTARRAYTIHVAAQHCGCVGTAVVEHHPTLM